MAGQLASSAVALTLFLAAASPAQAQKTETARLPGEYDLLCGFSPTY